MKKEKIFSVLLAVLFQLAECSKAKSEGLDDGYDYLDEDYYGFADETDEEPVEQAALPQFLTEPTTLKVNMGGTARLKCEVKELGPNTISWRKVTSNESSETTYIAVGPTLLTNDPRFQVTLNSRGSTLQIILAQDVDMGDYQCQVFSHPPVYLTHHLSIKKSAEVNILGKSASGAIYVIEGQELALICEGSGDPSPRISWRRQGRRLVDGAPKISGDQLFYKRVSRRHSGVYVCTADNGFGVPAEDRVEVVVKYAPSVSLDINYIHQQHSTHLEVICHIQGFPPPMVQWTGVEDIKDDIKYISRKERKILFIEDISLVSNRTVYCRGKNTLGEAAESYNFKGNLIKRETLNTTSVPPAANTNSARAPASSPPSPRSRSVRQTSESAPGQAEESEYRNSILNFLQGTKVNLERLDKNSKKNSAKILKTEMIGLDVLKTVQNLETSVRNVLRQQEMIVKKLTNNTRGM